MINPLKFLFKIHYNNRCDFCKKVWPKLVAVAKEFTKTNPDLKFAKVLADGPEAAELAKSEKIQGFPTIKFYYQGIPRTYEGQPSKEKLRAWIMRSM